MEEHVIWVTVLVNRLFGKPAAALLAALHIQPANPSYPIPNSVSMELLVLLIAVVFFLWLKARISVAKPGATQQVMEMVLTNPMGVGIRDLIKDNIPHGGDRYLPLIGSIGIFILFCNLINVIPTLDAPTATVSVPFGCAVIVFVYYNLSGVLKHGPLGHGKHFLGPILPMAPLMLPIELFSHSFRLLSLTVRLWVNMVVSEILYVVFLGMMLGIYVSLTKLGAVGYASAILPLTIPLLFIILHIFVAILQAFVFTILPIIYVSGAVEEAH
jgi:F-type H+-transporting ATPase subunit a